MLSREKSVELMNEWKLHPRSARIRFFCGPRDGVRAALQGYLAGNLVIVGDDTIAVNFSGNTVLLDTRDCKLELLESEQVPEPTYTFGAREPLETVLQAAFPTGELCLLFVFRPPN